MVASFHFCGTPPPRHMAITMTWNCSSIRRLPSRSSSKASLSSSAGSSSGPTDFRFDMLLMVSSTSKVEGKSSRDVHGGHSLSSSTMFGSSAGDFCIEQSAEPLYPPIANEPHVTKQTTLCVLDVMRNTRFLPLEVHPLKVLVETSLVAIFDAHFKLAGDFSRRISAQPQSSRA